MEMLLMLLGAGILNIFIFPSIDYYALYTVYVIKMLLIFIRKIHKIIHNKLQLWLKMF